MEDQEGRLAAPSQVLEVPPGFQRLGATDVDAPGSLERHPRGRPAHGRGDRPGDDRRLDREGTPMTRLSRLDLDLKLSDEIYDRKLPALQTRLHKLQAACQKREVASVI